MSRASGDISRRKFLVGVLASLATFLGLNLFLIRKKLGRWFSFLKFQGIATRTEGPNFALGHHIRAKNHFPKSAKEETVETLIIGGGISGLAAGRELKKKGCHDFKIIELESRAGGNSVSGKKGRQPFPWAAHYLPLPGKEAVYVREFLEEIGVSENGIYKPEYICSPIEERVFLFGRWQEGLYPNIAATSSDLAQKKRFDSLMDFYREAYGRDGRKAFTIPVSLSSRDERFTRLDSITMGEFLKQQELDSFRLRWFVEYGLKDDYGGNLNNISAWAGIHYFAGRPKNNPILIWPEGNAFLANAMISGLQSHLTTGHVVLKIGKENGKYRVLTRDMSGSQRVLRSKNVIFASPKFQLQYLFPEANEAVGKVAAQQGFDSLEKWEMSPWLVANLFLNRLPDSVGELAWDNVIFNTEGLGYVNNAHSSAFPGVEAVWTYYHAFHGDPTNARRFLFEAEDKRILKMVFDNLTEPHPDLHEVVTEVQWMKWAHAMIRPVPGFLKRWELPREIMDGFFLAHSDLSGISIFEEAQFQGIEAARALLG